MPTFAETEVLLDRIVNMGVFFDALVINHEIIYLSPDLLHKANKIMKAINDLEKEIKQ